MIDVITVFLLNSPTVFLTLFIVTFFYNCFKEIKRKLFNYISNLNFLSKVLMPVVLTALVLGGWEYLCLQFLNIINYIFLQIH